MSSNPTASIRHNAIRPQIHDLRQTLLKLQSLRRARIPEGDVLKQSIKALAALARVRFGAITALDDSGGLGQFACIGPTPAETDCFGSSLQAQGLLTAISASDTLRLDDLTLDPRFGALALHHPPLKSLVAVPIVQNSQHYGHVFLCDTVSGVPFDDKDEILVNCCVDTLALVIACRRAEAAQERSGEALRDISQALSAPSGDDFLPNLVLNLSRALGVDYVFVGEPKPKDPDVIRTVAFSDHGRLVDNMECHVGLDTQGGSVTYKAVYHGPDGIPTGYPGDRPVWHCAADALISYPLFDSAGRVIGLLVAMHEKPVADKERIRLILQLCANRVAAEIERRRTAETMRESEERFRSVVENIPLSIHTIDLQGRIMSINHAGLRMFGAEKQDEICGKEMIATASEPDRARVHEVLREALQGHACQFQFVTTSGRIFDSRLIPVKDPAGHSRYLLGVAEDITEHRQTQERLRYLAHYDPLTGLPNRVLLQDRLTQAMIEASRSEHMVGLLFIDLDRFKIINDTLGHEKGDALLKEVASRLKDCVRAGDTISRLGGDEFTVVLGNIAHVDDVARLAQAIIDSFVPPFRISGREMFISASIGITMYPFDDSDFDSLLRNADAAMYHAKELGRNTFQFYTAELNHRTVRRLRLETALRYALSRNELMLHYQPQVEFSTGAVSGAEVLLRWQHPDMGLVPPLKFIPLAEDTGLIVPIGEWVLRTACRQAQAWCMAGIRNFRIAVNLSGRQFQNNDLAILVETVLEETGLDPRCLDLEMTESILLHNTEEILAVMERLHSLGVVFSMDDFGTGYSSLSYLKRFPIDTLKIDQSFMRDIPTDPNDSAIAQAIIAMAHNLGIQVIAEGVETSAQRAFLRTHHCDGMQGYLFSKPLGPEKMTRLLLRNRTVARRRPLPRSPIPLRRRQRD
ncbi:MAG: EAL domain-containing protein [Acidiferrobacterales bacterium]